MALQAELCGTTILRAVNLGFAVACYLLAHATYRRIHPAVRSDYASQIVITSASIPRHACAPRSEAKSAV